ncbi:GNAT family N-acetyltransferase [Erysipelothrix sp. HDW6A]|uniref:GNAT family N-acetyltransferase n=1 Tax=Erysipelothrix sp. HDW6A TaxID=2714928 RepID=UPI00196AFEFB|nr:GNAT family N-acetyltransferase [Erysipelothrix sp. HDW6A]
MKIYLTRHGQTDWNVAKRIQGSTDIPLNQEGISQAQNLGNTLLSENINISKIYSSNKKRAIRTAQEVSEITEIPYEVVDDLQEVHLGEWEGLSWDEVREKDTIRYEKWFQADRRTVKSPQGESYQQVMERVLPKLLNLSKDHDEDILVVTHGAVIMSLLSLLNDAPFEEMTQFRVPNTKVVELTRSQVQACYKKFVVESIKLEKPSLRYLDSILRYKNTAVNSGEVLHGSSGLENFDNIEEWCQQTFMDEYKETVREGYVPATTFLCVRKSDEQVVGMINIRRELNDYLSKFGGHIGYSIHQDERRKSYAKSMLQKALEYCKEIGLEHVLITADSNNIASQKTIESCGGVFENEVKDGDGMLRRYWITL